MTSYEIEVTEPAEIGVAAACYHLPHRCPLAPENGRLDRPIRQLIYRHGQSGYRVLFIVIETTEEADGLIRIIRLLHGAHQHLGQNIEQPDEE